MKYKIGDKVRIVSEWNFKTNNNRDGGMDHWRGEVMTIRCIDGECYRMYEDRLEHWGDGWYWNEHCIAGLVSNTKKIVITVNGVETLARLYDDNKVVKSATAKCSPDDEFNFEFGAKLAMERLLIEDEKPKKENPFKVGDIVCIGNPPFKLPACNGMEKYAGKYGQVKEIYNFRNHISVLVKIFTEDCEFYWNADDLKSVERNEK